MGQRLKQLDQIISEEAALLVHLGEPVERCVEIIRSRHAELIAEVAKAVDDTEEAER